MKLLHSSMVSPAEMRDGVLLPINGVLWLAEAPYVNMHILCSRFWLYTVIARPPAVRSWDKKTKREGRDVSPISVGWWTAKVPLPWTDVQEVRRKGIELGEPAVAPSGAHFRHAVYLGETRGKELRARVLVEEGLLAAVKEFPAA
jgi:hypothetical protein